MSKRNQFALVAMVAVLVLGVDTMAQDGQSGGAPGCSSPGSAGMDEQGEPAFLQVVQKGRAQGTKSVPYMQSLIELGMFYNRQGRYADAARVLTEALNIVDGGALKPSIIRPPVPPLVQHHNNGTVSATNMNPATPYEDTMASLLPAIVEAQTETKQYALAEKHVKRLIALRAPNDVVYKLNLMSAYGAYAKLLRKQGRTVEAAQYERKMNEINASFKPL
jgi:tetratricopeptide (TPR) repeat protein